MSVFEKENIKFIKGAKSVDEMFDIISDLAISVGASSDKLAVKKGLFARENQGSTGFQDGFGIPHCRVPEIKNAKILFIRSEKGVKWETFDGKPLTTFFSLMIPEDGGDKHMKYLSVLATNLMNDSFTEAIKNSTDVNEIYKIVSKAIKD